MAAIIQWSPPDECITAMSLAGLGPSRGRKPGRGRLPPQAAVLEQQQKLAQRQETERAAVRELDPSSEEAVANTSDMQLVFFGTAAQRPTKARLIPLL